MSDQTDYNNNDAEQEDEVTRVSYRGEGENLDPIERSKELLLTDREYLETRVNKQIEYFDAKSSNAQKNYKKLKNREIFISSMIPFVITLSGFAFVEEVEIIKSIGFGLDTILQIAAALGGVYLVVTNKQEDLEKNFTIWKEFRATCEELQHELYLYRAKAEPYDESDAFPLFVTGVEAILHKETQRWMQIQRNDNKKKSGEEGTAAAAQKKT